MNKIFLSIIISFLMISSVFGIDERLKTGFFGGIDLGIKDEGLALYNISFSYINPTYGFKGGYQFYGSLKQGFRIEAYSNTSFMADKITRRSEVKSEVSDISFFSLHYGIGLDYLYDFYDNVNMTLGFSVGFGYELTSSFLKHKYSVVYFAPYDYSPNKFLNAKTPFFGGSPLYRIGFHAYFNHSQVEIGFSNPILRYGYSAYGSEELGLQKMNVSNIITTFFYCSYIYRF